MTNTNQKIHFIAIGGSLMHNLALALHQNGNHITGSDDEIFEPSRTKLGAAGLLPEKEGWYPEKITTDLSAVILGMHARKDNPELARARELNLPVYSFPEYLYQQSLNKQRIVIAGSHGKSTITAMIMHVLHSMGRTFDYAIGAEVPGFETMVRLSNAPVIVIEGDEYLTSAEDPSPKFMHYHHHIGLISGIEWDHVNVFPSEKDYVAQFKAFADATPKAGTLIYIETDPRVNEIGSQERADILALPYSTPEYQTENGKVILSTPEGKFTLSIFGKHNLQNLMGAKAVLNRIGVTDAVFYDAMTTFTGAGKRMEKISPENGIPIYRDYAHAPSKVEATVEAVKSHFPEKSLVACLELHTFSSLMSSFLPNYKGKMKIADIRIVYFNPATVTHKKLPALSSNDIKHAFQDDQLHVFTSREEMLEFLSTLPWEDSVLLLMSSGTFDKLDLQELNQLVDKP